MVVISAKLGRVVFFLKDCCQYGVRLLHSERGMAEQTRRIH